MLQRIEENARAGGISTLEYRLETFYWIVDERNNKVVRFRLNPVQRLLIRNFWWLTFVLKARQHGVSTLMAVMQLDACLFSSNYRAGVIDRTDAEAKKKLAKMKFAYDMLDKGVDGKPFLPGVLIKRDIQLVAPTNDHTLTFSNGSNVTAATTLRGGTVNFLWISEFGYIASEDPARANEIAAGSFNTVHPGNTIFIETTHEGGRFGLSYELVRAAQATSARPSLMEWRLLFFGWWENPDYKMEVPRGTTLQIPAQIERYFTVLERTIGQTLSEAQKNWYCMKAKSPGVDMARQFPGTIEEALSAQTEGAIYGTEMQLLRARGRVTPLTMNGHAPLFTYWDIGQSDYTGIWLIQPNGLDWLVLDYFTANGKTPAEYAAQLLLWEREYRPIRAHFLPHDAAKRDQNGKTYVDLLAAAGIRNIKVVPRTPDIWVGISAVREVLPNCWFNAERCEKEFRKEGERLIMPSGLGCLEGYRKKLEASGGTIKEQPIHNEASHGADAFRTFGEAWKRGMMREMMGPGSSTDEIRVIRGPARRGHSQIQVVGR